VRRSLAAALLILAVCAGCSPVSQVRLRLPLKPRLPLRGNEKILLAPFLIVTEADKVKDKRLQNVDLQGEFHRFLKRQIEKKTKLEVVNAPADLKLPTQSLSELGRSTEFWRSLGSTTEAEILVSGSLEFRVEDRSGYKTEEYVSPINGQTYYRQVYVEQSGFLFDIVFLVFDGRSGEKLLQDEFKDFRQSGGSSRADELQGLFENLFSLENQILNMFVAREREADRYLFTS
jgi:Lipopolysaccharide-assembly